MAESPLFDPEAAVSAFRRALPGAKAAVCTMVSNVFGYLLPVREIAELCAAAGVPLIVDASQAAGCVAFDAAALGDAAARDVVRGYLADVACGLVNLVQIFQPERIVLGGGISGQGEALLGPVRSVLSREDYARHHTKRTELSIAALGNDAGLIGAALIRRFD